MENRGCLVNKLGLDWSVIGDNGIMSLTGLMILPLYVSIYLLVVFLYVHCMKLKMVFFKNI